MDDYVATQYDTKIETFFNRNNHYSEVALDYYKPGLIQGGPSVEYSLLFNNLEAWNIFTLKLETTNLQLEDITKFIEAMKDLKQYLEQTTLKS